MLSTSLLLSAGEFGFRHALACCCIGCVAIRPCLVFVISLCIINFQLTVLYYETLFGVRKPFYLQSAAEKVLHVLPVVPQAKLKVRPELIPGLNIKGARWHMASVRRVSCQFMEVSFELNS